MIRWKWPGYDLCCDFSSLILRPYLLTAGLTLSSWQCHSNPGILSWASACCLTAGGGSAWQAAGSSFKARLLPPASAQACAPCFVYHHHTTLTGCGYQHVKTGAHLSGDLSIRVFSSCQQTEGSSFRSCLHLAPAFWACALHSCAASARAAHTQLHIGKYWFDNILSIAKISCPLIAANITKITSMCLQTSYLLIAASRGSYSCWFPKHTVQESACWPTKIIYQWWTWWTSTDIRWCINGNGNRNSDRDSKRSDAF